MGITRTELALTPMAGDRIYSIHAHADGSWTQHRALAWCLVEVNDHGDVFREILPVIAEADCPSLLQPDTDDGLIAIVHGEEIEPRRDELTQLAQKHAADLRRLAARQLARTDNPRTSEAA